MFFVAARVMRSDVPFFLMHPSLVPFDDVVRFFFSPVVGAMLGVVGRAIVGVRWVEATRSKFRSVGRSL